MCCNISTEHISINDQNKIQNYQIRYEQLTNQTKKSKKNTNYFEINFHKRQYQQPPNIEIASVPTHVRNMLYNLQTQLLQFIDTPNQLKKFKLTKPLKLNFFGIPGLSTIQQKQCSHISPYLKRNLQTIIKQLKVRTKRSIDARTPKNLTSHLSI